jgi:hypothetical protein
MRWRFLLISTQLWRLGEFFQSDGEKKSCVESGAHAHDLVRVSCSRLLLSSVHLGVMVMAVVTMMVRVRRGKCRNGEQQNNGQDQKLFHALSLSTPPPDESAK